MKWQTGAVPGTDLTFEIEHDAAAGYYLYVFENGKCVRDHLQDTFDAATQQAFVEYRVPIRSWKQNGDSETASFLKRMAGLIQDYLDHKIGPDEFTLRFDTAMANEGPDDLPPEVYSLLDDYQTDFAMFESDPVLRREAPDDLFGEEVLSSKAQVLLILLGSYLPSV